MCRKGSILSERRSSRTGNNYTMGVWTALEAAIVSLINDANKAVG